MLFLPESAGLEDPKPRHKGAWEAAIRSRLQTVQGDCGQLGSRWAEGAHLPLLRRDGMSENQHLLRGILQAINRKTKQFLSKIQAQVCSAFYTVSNRCALNN